MLIYNPVSGGGRVAGRVEAIRARLEAGGWRLDARPTRGPGDATALAAAAVESGFDAVFAAGGDGTLRETAAGLAGSALPMAVLPGGTANVLALALGIEGSLRAAAAAYARSEPVERRIDVGRCSGTPFLMMASVGPDAAVLDLLSNESKKHLGKLAVFGKGLATLRHYGWPRRRAVWPDGDVTASFICISNIPYYGGPFEIAPRADPCDGRLDLVAFDSRRTRDMLLLALDVALASHGQRVDIASGRSEQFHIEAEIPFLYQLDGDAFTAAGPLEIGVDPGALRLLLPADAGRSWISRPAGSANGDRRGDARTPSGGSPPRPHA